MNISEPSKGPAIPSVERRSGGRRPRRRREWALALALLLPLGLLLLTVAPIPQDLSYHAFADARAYWDIPNFLNVVSNIPFLLVGVGGLMLSLAPREGTISRSWVVFFLATGLVSLGSGYYHWAPDNETLVWDRLPIALVLMGLLSALLGEHIGGRVERATLGPALVLGILSVAWWDYADDLRLYVWVQATPLLLVPLAVAIYPAKYTHRRYLLYGLGAYVLSRIAEFYDREIFLLSAQTVSGHTLKHLLAALGIFFVYLMLRRRQALVETRPAFPAA